jgi:hypothetical protein
MKAIRKSEKERKHFLSLKDRKGVEGIICL